MKFLKFLPALLVAIALVGTVGCGGGEKTTAEQQKAAVTEQAKERVIQDTLRQVNQLQSMVEALGEENANLRRSVGEMQERLIIQRERMNDANRLATQIRTGLAEETARLATPAPAPEPERRGGFAGFLFVVLIIIIGIIILILLIRAFAGGRNEFDGEDDDFDDLDDEDFGFEDDDEDFEDEIGDDKDGDDDASDDDKDDKKK